MTATHRFGAAALGLALIAAPAYFNTGIPAARAAERGHGDGDGDHRASCSLARLNGTYGFTTTGSIVAAGPVGLVADVGVMTFDGAGSVSEREWLSLNGAPGERVSGGEYTLEGDCTGVITLVLPPPATGVAISNFVLVDEGRELRAIVMGPGRVLTTVARRQ
jgi:hypothetical protein